MEERSIQLISMKKTVENFGKTRKNSNPAMVTFSIVAKNSSAKTCPVFSPIFQMVIRIRANGEVS